MITKIVIENVKKLITDNLSELIDDAVNQYIYDTVEEEVTKHTEYKINGILEHISKVHGISLDLLLRDAPLAGMNGICKGSKNTPNGPVRCTFKGNHDGYCKFHLSKGIQIRRRELSSENIHTHGPEQMYVVGCPGCEKSNELIGMRSIFNNE